MRKTGDEVTVAGSSEERCDIHVWSDACDHGDGDSEERYLCKFCETITDLDHEIRHEIYPHVSGDYTTMS